MATRSRIGEVLPNGSICSVYCHNDGHPGGVGATLVKSYTNAAKIRALLTLGNLSELGDEVAPPAGRHHDFNHPIEGVTIAYRRDRRDGGTNAALISHTFADFALHCKDCGAEFAYLWENGAWKAYKPEGVVKLAQLASVTTYLDEEP